MQLDDTNPVYYNYRYHNLEPVAKPSLMAVWNV